MSKLTKLLEYSCAGNSRRRSLMDDDSFIKHFSKDEHQLLLSETGETDLIVREVLNAVVVGAEERQSARNIVPIVNTTTNKIRVPRSVSPSGQYSGYVGEGATIPIDTIRYSSTNIDIRKAAIRVPITRELIEDQQFDIIELELKKAGAKLENQLNREVITEFLNNASVNTDIDPNDHAWYTGGVSGAILLDVGLAKERVDNKGWIADSLFIQGRTYAYLLDETNLSDIAGDHKILGLKVELLDATTTGITQLWDGVDAANHYGAFVFDSKNYGVIAMREDIGISEIKDPIQDLTNLIVKMRFGVGVLNKDAACRILTK